MARKAHLTDVGLITFDDLTELGAGKREGWLSDPSVLAAIHPRCLALAGSSLAVVIPWGDYDNNLNSSEYDFPEQPIMIRPFLPEDGEITAVEWMSVGEVSVLALGTSLGYLLVYSMDNELILKQIVHNGRVLRLRFREVEEGETRAGGGGKDDDDVDDDAYANELCVVLPGVIARFDGSDIKNFLERWYRERQSNGWDSRNRISEEGERNSFGKIPYRVWNVGKHGPCADAAITGLMPPPLLELQSEKRYFCAVTIGSDAVISAFRLSDHRSRSIVRAIFSTVVPAAFSTITSFSKLIWRSNPSSDKKPKETPQSFARAAPLTCLKDSPRKGDKLTLSPSGTLAAITDSLGRILLLDTRALVVVRLWKGYRDACCLFMEMLIDEGKGKSTSSIYRSEHRKSNYCLCLAIHAPKRGIVEVWKMRTGPRVFAIQCPNGSKILQPSSRKLSAGDTSKYIPLEVYLLNGDSGQLSLLNK